MLNRSTLRILADAQRVIGLRPKATKRTYYLTAEGRISTHRPEAIVSKTRATTVPQARQIFKVA